MNAYTLILGITGNVFVADGPGVSPSTSGSPAAATTAGEAFPDIWVTVSVLIAVVLGSIAVLSTVFLARKYLADDGKTYIRSVLALLLVMGLLVFCGILLTTQGQDDLRNLVFGALVASVASGTAYYFASKDADAARKDMLTFMEGGSVTVPDLGKQTVAKASEMLGSTTLRLVVMPDVPVAERALHRVVMQSPAAGSIVQPRSDVTVSAKRIAVSGLTSSVTDHDVNLAWKPPADIASVIVRRSDAEAPTPRTCTDGEEVSTADLSKTGADHRDQDGVYHYSVFVKDADGMVGPAQSIDVKVPEPAGV